MPVATSDRSQLPDAVDLSHHLSLLSRSRMASPLKEMFRYMAEPGMLSLGGGLPHASIFPFRSMSFEALPASTHLDAAKPDTSAAVLDAFSITHEHTAASTIDLKTSLQYGECNGLPAVREFARAFTEAVHQPAYANYEILMHDGNTDGWGKTVSLLADSGAYILCEEHTFPQAYWIPMGCIGVPIKLDGQGMRSDHLASTMENWDSTHPGVKRPALMYIVPVGQNPTGATMLAQRRQEIYDLCVKWDIIICEDDPYTYLQFPEYVVDGPPAANFSKAVTSSEFAASLTPSFLKFDYQGRVIRLETFSKTLAPGCRLGFFVCNPMFAERLLRATEISSQSPSGWSQAIITELVTKWGTDGYLQWLASVRDVYCVRRNWMLDAFKGAFDLVPATEAKVIGAEGLVAFKKGTGSLPNAVPMFSFVPPSGGMFVWTKHFLGSNSHFQALAADATVVDPETTFMENLWKDLAAKKVLLTPGAYYAPWQGADKATTTTADREAGVGHFRLAYSFATREEIELAVARIRAALEESWA
ncbi:hypothetical protein RQP46_006326 [Phenoliferia psychrophenolica]